MSINLGAKQKYKNLGMNILAFGIQFLISFYISPIIIKKLGVSGNGFITLANDFVSYASILATIFNSVAARFIASSYYQKEFDKANKYFNSLVTTNIILSGLIGVVGTVVVINLEQIIDIPSALMLDVKWTFAFVFIAYIISLVTMVYTTSTFVTNRTDIQGVRNIIQNFIRFAIIILLLNLFSTHIYWVALATLIATTMISIINVRLTKRLTPEIKLNIRDSSLEYVIELAKSGGWMAFTSISTILLRGLDLYIANRMIGNYEMGILSIARMMPNNITAIIATIAPIFTPVFIALYAKKDTELLLSTIKNSISTITMILFVPITGFLLFSYDFYALWQKSLTNEELVMITMLSSLTIIQAYFNATTSTIAQLSVVVNKLKIPVFVSFGSGVMSIVIELLLIRYTDLGLYAIVLSTTVIMILRYIVFNSIYAAYCLEQPWTTFVFSQLKAWLTIPLLVGTMLLIKMIRPIHSWIDLGIVISMCGILGYIEMALLYKRNVLINLAKNFIHKRKG